jgi:hypothetical protein
MSIFFFTNRHEMTGMGPSDGERAYGRYAYRILNQDSVKKARPYAYWGFGRGIVARAYRRK